MDTMDAERLERRLNELENYMLDLERQINKLNSEERIIVEDAHCLIQLFARLCECCGVKRANKTRSTKESSYDFKESSEQQSRQKHRKSIAKAVPRPQRTVEDD